MIKTKFRGKTRNNGWVYGYLCSENQIKTEGGGVHIVNKKTVSQFTGLKDADGEEIFEDDILETWSKRYEKEKQDREGDLVVIRWTPLRGYMLHYVFDWCGISNNVEYADSVSTYKKVGNIHDNKDLIKVTKRF